MRLGITAKPFKESARQLVATFMLHQRFWVNDPVLVGRRDYVHKEEEP
jgi:hypothetical protein